MKKLMLILALLIVRAAGQSCPSGGTHIWNAASCSKADVTQCVSNAASTGDTINVPAGTCPWSGNITITGKQVNVVGAGMASTIITGDAFTLDTIAAISSTVPSVRVTAMAFQLGGNGHYFTLQEVKGYRLDHIAFSNATASWQCLLNYGFTSTNWGVIDSSTSTYCQWETLGGDYLNTSNGDNIAWSMASPQGTQFASFYEDNTFVDPDPSSNGYFNCFDAEQGGAYVVRFSLLSGCRFEGHGVQGDLNRGTRSMEYYGNTICGNSPTVSVQGVCPSPNVGNPGYSGTFPRGGQFKFFHNWFDNNWLHYQVRIDCGPRCEEDSINGQVPNWQFCDGTTQSTYFNGSGNVTYPSPKTLIIDAQGTGGYRCRDQLGAGVDASTWAAGFSTVPPAQALAPAYFWKNPPPGGGADPSVAPNCETPGDILCNNMSGNLFINNRDYYSLATSFTGATGIGEGPRASRPSTCTPFVAWWATDDGSWNTLLAPNTSGVLDVCTATNTWTNAYYVPYTYPNPLRGTFTPSSTSSAQPANGSKVINGGVIK